MQQQQSQQQVQVRIKQYKDQINKFMLEVSDSNDDKAYYDLAFNAEDVTVEEFSSLTFFPDDTAFSASVENSFYGITSEIKVKPETLSYKELTINAQNTVFNISINAGDQINNLENSSEFKERIVEEIEALFTPEIEKAKKTQISIEDEEENEENEKKEQTLEAFEVKHNQEYEQQIIHNFASYSTQIAVETHNILWVKIESTGRYSTPAYFRVDLENKTCTTFDYPNMNTLPRAVSTLRWSDINPHVLTLDQKETLMKLSELSNAGLDGASEELSDQQKFYFFNTLLTAQIEENLPFTEEFTNIFASESVISLVVSFSDEGLAQGKLRLFVSNTLMNEKTIDTKFELDEDGLWKIEKDSSEINEVNDNSLSKEITLTETQRREILTALIKKNEKKLCEIFSDAINNAKRQIQAEQQMPQDSFQPVEAPKPFELGIAPKRKTLTATEFLGKLHEYCGDKFGDGNYEIKQLSEGKYEIKVNGDETHESRKFIASKDQGVVLEKASKNYTKEDFVEMLHIALHCYGEIETLEFKGLPKGADELAKQAIRDVMAERENAKYRGVLETALGKVKVEENKAPDGPAEAPKPEGGDPMERLRGMMGNH